MSEKSMGQIAYEAFQVAYLPKGVQSVLWAHCPTWTRQAWEAAAGAVLAQPHRGCLIGGPIEMRGYDYVTLARPHRLVVPDQPEPVVPAGTRLYMIEPGPESLGLTYQTGGATRVTDSDPPDSGELPVREPWGPAS